MTHDGNGSEPEVSGSSPMSGTPQPDDLARLAEKQQVAGRHHVALDSLRPYFVARDLDPAGASAFVRLSLDVSRVLCEMGLAETAAGLWSVILPGLAGGKPIDRARWVLLGAEACAASNEGGCTVTRLADTVERDALDTPAGPAQRFLRAAAGLAQAAIDGWRHDRGRSRSSPGHLPSLTRMRSWRHSASAPSSCWSTRPSLRIVWGSPAGRLGQPRTVLLVQPARCRFSKPSGAGV